MDFRTNRGACCSFSEKFHWSLVSWSSNCDVFPLYNPIDSNLTGLATIVSGLRWHAGSHATKLCWRQRIHAGQCSAYWVILLKDFFFGKPSFSGEASVLQGVVFFWWGGANYSKQYTGLAGGILPTWLESWLWDRGCRTSRNWKMKHESNNWINWTFTHQSSTDYQTLVSNVEHQALQQLMLDPPKGQAELGWKKTWLVSIRWTEDPQSGSFPAWGNMSHVGHKRPFCKTLVTLLWDPILFENKIWVFVCNVKLPIIKTISCLVNSLDLLLVFSHNYLFWLSYKAQPQANKWSIERKTTVLHQTGSSI